MPDRGLTGGDVDGNQLLAERRDEDSFRPSPSVQYSMPAGLQGLHVGLTLGVALGVVDPQFTSGGGIEGGDLAVGGHRVDAITDFQGGGTVLARVVAAPIIQGDIPIGGLPAPGDLQLGEVVGVDLGQGRVLGGGVIATVVAPFAARRARVGDYGKRRPEDGC